MTDARWRGALLAALAVSLLGLIVGESTLFVLALVPLGYVVFSALSGVPSADVRISRSVSDEQPRPGADVTVTVTVENAGDRPLSDVRVADAPPEGIPIDGTTRMATSLRAGETETFTYDLNLPRGEFDFGTPAVRVRNLAGTTVRSVTPAVEGTTHVVCQTVLDAVPLQDYTIRYVGRTPTDAGGSGVEFYATREYQRGDPVNRINWRRYARTGELSTVNLREERAMTIVFLIDDRPDQQRSQPGYGPDSLDLSVYAASRGLATLVDENHRVGVGLLSKLGQDGGYVTPGSGPTVEAAARDAFENAAGDGDDPARADGGAQSGPTGSQSTESSVDTAYAARQLAARLPPRAQVVCCTPLTDDLGQTLADVLTARGYALTILSPDMTTGSDDVSAAAGIESIHRDVRIRRLQRRGVPVVDWTLDAPLAMALAEVFETGGRSL